MSEYYGNDAFETCGVSPKETSGSGLAEGLLMPR